ncbi:MAG: hypothetical protein KC731_28055, partial [Myxococcales bacterium]|nr:hypothetical protein [Myxococcales bacterium]
MASFRSKLARLTPKGSARAVPDAEPEPELSALRQALAHALGRPAASSRVGSGEAPPLEQDDLALTVVERENPALKGSFTKNYARPTLDKHRLGEL